MNDSINQETMPATALHLLQASDFQPLLGQDFTIRFTEDVRVIAQLETVLALPDYSGLERKPFSIILQTDLRSTFYPQAIYSVEHSALGSLAIFLVPVGVKGKGIQYEAVFS